MTSASRIKLSVQQTLPKTLEDLYSIKLDQVTEAIKGREEHNMGRRMASCTNEYVWDGTPWDWVLRELSHIGADKTCGRKWKRVAAYKLAKAAKETVPKIIADWKYKEVSTKLVALKTSTIIKQAFYEQYTCLKKAKEELGQVADVNNKKGRMGKRLRDIMQWVIVNYEFQYEVKAEAYHSLNLKLNPNFERKSQTVKAQEEENKDNENNLFMSKVPSVSLYDPFEYNYDAPRLMSLADPPPESLLTLGPSSLTDSPMNMDLSNLMEVPLCDYDEIVSNPLNILGHPKLEETKIEPKNETQIQEYTLLNNVSEIFFAPTKDKKNKVEDVIMFDVNEELKHTIYNNEDEEFMEYYTYLPEYNDPLYSKLKKRWYILYLFHSMIFKYDHRNKPSQQVSRLEKYNQSIDKYILTPIEDTILEWSVTTIGRSWNVITDILQNHPLATGRRQNPNNLLMQYTTIQYKKKKPFYYFIRIDPVVDDKTPILGRFKTYLLTNKVLPIYTQRYVAINNNSNEEKPKAGRKRRLRELSFPYETRELKYKCTGEDSSFNAFTKKAGVLNINEDRKTIDRSKVLYNEVGSDFKAPIYYFVKGKQVKKNTIEKLDSLLYCRDESTDRPKMDIAQTNMRNEDLLNSELNISRLLEAPNFQYQETFKHNWKVMTNSWYQNHKNLIQYARKPSHVIKVERNGSIPSVQPERNHQPQNIPCTLYNLP